METAAKAAQIEAPAKLNGKKDAGTATSSKATPQQVKPAEPV